MAEQHEEQQESFEKTLHALEEAVELLETGDLPLEEALRCFEQGVRSASRCREALKAMETRVELLLKGADGSLTVEDFDQE